MEGQIAEGERGWKDKAICRHKKSKIKEKTHPQQ
jgi:hypothetical protein